MLLWKASLRDPSKPGGLDETWQLLVYTVFICCVKDVRHSKENRSLSVTSVEVGLEVNAEKTIYRVSQEERAKLREGVPYVKLYRHNPKHLYPKLNGYGGNGQRKVWTSCISAFYTPTAVSRATPPSRSSDCVQSVRWLVLRRTSSTQCDKTVLHCC